MARDTSPQCKQCRREGQKLFLKGERCLTDKCGVERRSYPPGEHGRGRQKQSEYRVQLREKQKARRYYGIQEKQFRQYYEKASRQSGITGQNLLSMLESRLDNVLVRLGFAASRRQARQLIGHGHWTVNGRRVDIPSYQLRGGDVIAVKAGTPAENVEDNRGSFTVEPLDRGFGYTFGNSLRRVLLSSLAGAAVTSVRIEGVAHEFSTVKGVKEDVTDIVLNLKGIVCRMHSDATEIEAPLVVTGPGEITAADIDLPSGVEILNPDAHIATLEKKTKLELYLTIGRGRGYVPAEDNKSPDQPIGVIPIDSIFSPVRRVAYAVEQARVGQRTDYDKLTLDIETDGPLEPQAALRAAAEILMAHLAIFTDAEIEPLGAPSGGALEPGGAPVGAAAGGPAPSVHDDILIEELELGVRSYNCLKRAGIQTVGELISKSEGELGAIPNFGKKSIDEVIETLHARGLALREG